MKNLSPKSPVSCCSKPCGQGKSKTDGQEPEWDPTFEPLMKVILGKKGLKTKSASEVSWRKDVCVCFWGGGGAYEIHRQTLTQRKEMCVVIYIY